MFEICRQQWKSLVEELPVKGTTSALVLGTVRKVLIVDDVDERTDDCLVALSYWLCVTMTTDHTEWALMSLRVVGRRARAMAGVPLQSAPTRIAGKAEGRWNSSAAAEQSHGLWLS